MQLTNLSNSEMVILNRFKQWISSMPVENLGNISIGMFVIETKTLQDDAQHLFDMLVKEGLAAPNIKLDCPNCGDLVLVDNIESAYILCGNCEHKIFFRIDDAKSFSYKIDRNALLSMQLPFSEKALVRGMMQSKQHTTIMKVNSKMEPIKIDMIIITALPEELEPIKQILKDMRTEIIGPHTYYHGQFVNAHKSIRVVAAHSTMMGMVASCLLATELIDTFKPKYIVMVGMAAATNRSTYNYGDILAATQVWDYGSGKIVKDSEGRRKFEPAPTPITISPYISNLLTQFSNDSIIFHNIKKQFSITGNAPQTELKLHIGPMASGSSVVANADVIEEVRLQQRKIIGIEMENYGVYFAAMHNRTSSPIYFSMKSVVDYADEEKSDNYHKYACFTCANALYEFWNKYLAE